MSKISLAMGGALCALCLVVSGCGGAGSNSESAASQDKGFVDPFGGDADLRAGGEAEPEVDIDPEDLEIPGAEYGTKKQKGGNAKANCPKGKKGKKCRRQAKKSSGPIPFSDAIADQMKGIPWGMHYKAVMAGFRKRITQAYDEELKTSVDALEEHKIREKMTKEIKKLEKSYIEFNGQRTGYEGAVLEKEFTHNNGESLLVWDAGKFVEYLFFFNGRFWKRFRTFRKEKLNIENFESYVATLTQNFGQGKEVRNAAGELEKVLWQDKTTYMTAMDQSGFYGVYSLSFTAKVTEDNLAKLRTAEGRADGSVDQKVSNMVSEVTSGSLADDNSSVVDSYTGVNEGTTTTIDSSDSVMGKDTKVQKGGKKKAGKGGGDQSGGGGGGGGGADDGADIF